MAYKLPIDPNTNYGKFAALVYKNKLPIDQDVIREVNIDINSGINYLELFECYCFAVNDDI